jgi:hypothetical protein
MPASPRITKDDIQAELSRLQSANRLSFRILTEQAPPDDFNPERVGLVDIPQRQQN